MHFYNNRETKIGSNKNVTNSNAKRPSTIKCRWHCFINNGDTQCIKTKREYLNATATVAVVCLQQFKTIATIAPYAMHDAPCHPQLFGVSTVHTLPRQRWLVSPFYFCLEKNGGGYRFQSEWAWHNRTPLRPPPSISKQVTPKVPLCVVGFLCSLPEKKEGNWWRNDDEHIL